MSVEPERAEIVPCPPGDQLIKPLTQFIDKNSKQKHSSGFWF